MVKFTNFVLAAYLNCKIDLRELCLNMSNCVYNPKKFPGLVMENRLLSSKALLFSNSSNSYLNVQANDYKLGIKSLRSYARLIQKRGYHVKLGKIKLITASATHALDCKKLNLDKLVEYFNQQDYSYHPELFNAAYLRTADCCFCIFPSGKINICGIKSPFISADILEILNKLNEVAKNIERDLL